MKNITAKKVLKILIIAVVIIAIAFISTKVFALDPSDVKPTDVEAGDFLEKAQRVAGFIRNIAIIASVIVIMVLGVKYILGSVEEKAEYKKSFMPLIIGIILVVAATSIASFIFNIAK